MARVKYLLVKYKYKVINCPNFHVSGSITGMKKKFYGKNALLVRCGSWIYNVSRKRDVYYNWAK